jgi:hypothetical protein
MQIKIILKFTILPFLFFPFILPAQTMKRTKSMIGFSIPVIWNNSEATFYRLGEPMQATGKALSYGMNGNYSRFLYKNIYGTIGAGYFKQTFGIIRPFKYNSPLAFLFSTEAYFYDNAHVYLGIGYKAKITERSLILTDIRYNQYYSFRQKYINHSPVKAQIDNEKINLGRTINLNTGVRRSISKQSSVGFDAILPFVTRWNNDKIFINNSWSNIETRIAKNKFSLGLNVAFNYNF